MPGMEKYADYVLPYKGYYSAGGICRVRLYRPAGDEEGYRYRRVALLSDLPENDNTTVTNMVEVLCCEVALDRALPEGTLFVEHVHREEGESDTGGLSEVWSLVEFAPPGWQERAGEAAGLPYRLARFGAGASRPSYGSPTWSHVSREEMGRIMGENAGLLLAWEPMPARPVMYEARRNSEAERLREAESFRGCPGDGGEPELTPVFSPGKVMDGLSLEDLACGLPGITEQAVILKRKSDPYSPQARGEAHTNVERRVSGGGHEWGYLGSGPSNLALDILAALVPAGADGMPSVDAPGGACSATAWRLRHPFKEQVLARLPYEGGVIDASRIWEWMASAFSEEGSGTDAAL